MKYYVDNDANLFAFYSQDIDTIENIDQLKEITFEEAQAIANPPLSQAEIDQQQSQENIAFLSSETRRTEAEIKIYERMRDRNRADEDDLNMLEALEDYSIDLRKVTKQKGWPLEVDWPVAPDF